MPIIRYGALSSMKNISNNLKTHIKRTLRSALGFTLVELMAIVAIIAILAGISTVAIVTYQRKLEMMKLDNMAQEVYLAAQNHLTTAESGGTWSALLKEAGVLESSGKTSSGKINNDTDPTVVSALGNADSSATVSTSASDYDLRYINSSDYSTNGRKAYSIMLPAGSIEGSGQFVIEYDTLSASVYGVWYTEGSGNTVSYSDVSSLLASNSNARTDASVRESYKNSTGSRNPIGYYGSESGTFTASTDEYRFNNMTGAEVSVDNGNTLSLSITDNNAKLPEYEIVDKNNPSTVKAKSTTPLNTDIDITITGEESGVSYTFNLTKDGTSQLTGTSSLTLGGKQFYQTKWTSNLSGSKQSGTVLIKKEDQPITETNASGIQTVRQVPKYTIILDSITIQGEHFAEAFPDMIPGENIDISVDTKASSGNVITKGESFNTSLTTNSIFADNSGSGTAYISNGRHLENLSTEISNVNNASNIASSVTRNLANGNNTFDGSKEIYKNAVLQKTDKNSSNSADADSKNTIYWNKADASDFINAIFNDGLYTNNGSSSSPSANTSVSVYKYKSTTGEKANYFYPVKDTRIEKFDGNNFTLSYFYITTAGYPGKDKKGNDTTYYYAGLFSYIDSSGTGVSKFTVSNIKLSNCTVRENERAKTGLIAGYLNTSVKAVFSNISISNCTLGCPVGTATKDNPNVKTYSNPGGSGADYGLICGGVKYNSGNPFVNVNEITVTDSTKVNGSDNTGGLFGSINGASNKSINISNVTIAENSEILGYHHTGGLVGEITGNINVNANNIEISDSSVISTAYNQNKNFCNAGGLFGDFSQGKNGTYTNTITIENVDSQRVLVGTGGKDCSGSAGGVVGYFTGGNLTIRKASVDQHKADGTNVESGEIDPSQMTAVYATNDNSGEGLLSTEESGTNPSAGGFVGTLVTHDKTYIIDSMSSVYVYSKGHSGGLIGTNIDANSDSNTLALNIYRSYVAGHTTKSSNGNTSVYDSTSDTGVTKVEKDSSGNKSVKNMAEGRINISGYSAAGGLVGVSCDAATNNDPDNPKFTYKNYKRYKVSYSYALVSVGVRSKTYTNAYILTGNASSSKEQVSDDSSYYYGFGAVVNGKNKSAYEAASKNTKISKIYTADGTGSAKPYLSILGTNAFTYKTISQLLGDNTAIDPVNNSTVTLADYESAHYGDWIKYRKKYDSAEINNGTKLTVKLTKDFAINKDNYITVKVKGLSSGNTQYIGFILHINKTNTNNGENVYKLTNVSTEVKGGSLKAASNISKLDEYKNNINKCTHGYYLNGKNGSKSLYLWLDDITVSGGHFAEIFGTLYPGENIDVWAASSTSGFVEPTDDDYVDRTNSLFATGSNPKNINKADDTAEDAHTALIANARNLENLDFQVSGVNAVGTDITKLHQNCYYTDAIQTNDIIWKGISSSAEVTADSNVVTYSVTDIDENGNYKLQKNDAVALVDRDDKSKVVTTKPLPFVEEMEYLNKKVGIENGVNIYKWTNSVETLAPGSVNVFVGINLGPISSYDGGDNTIQNLLMGNVNGVSGLFLNADISRYAIENDKTIQTDSFKLNDLSVINACLGAKEMDDMPNNGSGMIISSANRKLNISGINFIYTDRDGIFSTNSEYVCCSKNGYSGLLIGKASNKVTLKDIVVNIHSNTIKIVDKAGGDGSASSLLIAMLTGNEDISIDGVKIFGDKGTYNIYGDNKTTSSGCLIGIINNEQNNNNKELSISIRNIEIKKSIIELNNQNLGIYIGKIKNNNSVTLSVDNLKLKDDNITMKNYGEEGTSGWIVGRAEINNSSKFDLINSTDNENTTIEVDFNNSKITMNGAGKYSGGLVGKVAGAILNISNNISITADDKSTISINVNNANDSAEALLIGYCEQVSYSGKIDIDINNLSMKGSNCKNIGLLFGYVKNSLQLSGFDNIKITNFDYNNQAEFGIIAGYAVTPQISSQISSNIDGSYVGNKPKAGYVSTIFAIRRPFWWQIFGNMFGIGM